MPNIFNLRISLFSKLVDEFINNLKLFSGTPDGSGVLTVLDFVGCQLTELGANTVPITAGAALIDFAENSISVIDPTAFVVRSEPGKIRKPRSLKFFQLQRLYCFLEGHSRY